MSLYKVYARVHVSGLYVYVYVLLNGATNTVKVEIQKVGEKLEVITLETHFGTLSVFTLKNDMT